MEMTGVVKCKKEVEGRVYEIYFPYQFPVQEANEFLAEVMQHLLKIAKSNEERAQEQESASSDQQEPSVVEENQ